jgi:hypothetical protein
MVEKSGIPGGGEREPHIQKLRVLSSCDIKDMSKIVTKQKYLNFDRRKTLRK